MAFEPENLVPMSQSALENIEAALGDVKQVAPEVWSHVEQTMTDEVRRIETTMTMMVSDIHTAYQTKHDAIALELEKAQTTISKHVTMWNVLGVAVVVSSAGYLITVLA